MAVTAALERELVATERELFDSLMLVLPVCAKNGTMIFFNSGNLPDEYQHNWLPAESDELFELATRCSSIRSSLGLSNVHTIAQLFLDACAENGNMKNPHRRGPRRLATWLLSEFQSRFST
jgi:hypothetical protein